jgi:DNA-binding beta-propeller fold protein YncE
VLYVSNVRDGTVTRIDLHIDERRGQPTPHIDRLTVIASGFAHRPDPNALVVGPTGLLLDRDHDALYVADTGNNRVQLIGTVRERGYDAGPGRTVVSGAPLKGPLALAFTPIGTIVASNGDAAGDATTPPNLVVEFDPQSGRFVTTRQLDTSGVAGAIFGIAIARVNGRVALIYVNDNTATLNVQP